MADVGLSNDIIEVVEVLYHIFIRHGFHRQKFRLFHDPFTAYQPFMGFRAFDSSNLPQALRTLVLADLHPTHLSGLLHF
jgi:hypothetical protein